MAHGRDSGRRGLVMAAGSYLFAVVSAPASASASACNESTHGALRGRRAATPPLVISIDASRARRVCQRFR